MQGLILHYFVYLVWCWVGSIQSVGWIPGSGRFHGERHGNPLKYSSWEILWTSWEILRIPSRKAWQATVHRVAKNRTQLSMYTCTYTHLYMCVSVCVCVCVRVYPGNRHKHVYTPIHVCNNEFTPVSLILTYIHRILAFPILCLHIPSSTVRNLVRNNLFNLKLRLK